MIKRIAYLLSLFLCLGVGVSSAEDGMVARVGEAGDVLEFRHQVDGTVSGYHLPLYRTGNIRYFSAGVGLEERQASYPLFSLKLVFTAGGRPFLTGVDVTIQPTNGDSAINISREQVEGPWLFVDLPSGVYDISAAQGEYRQELKGIRVEAGKQRTVHLRWAEDRGVMRSMVGE